MAGLDESVWTEVVTFVSKGRIGLPLAARKRIDWWAVDISDGLLAILEPGSVAWIEPWANKGEELLRRTEQMIRTAQPETKSSLVLAAMDRYMRVSCETNGRLVFPANLIAHIDPTSSGKARVIVADGSLKICSEEEWQAGRSQRLFTLEKALAF